MFNILNENIDLYRSLFNTRDDLFATYWEDFSHKKSGYAPVYSLNQNYQALTDTIILSHLKGNQTIGVYPLFPDNTTAFLVIDFDGLNWFNLIQNVAITALNNNLFCTIERSKSGNGGHLWFFFNERLPAFKVRQMGKLLLNQSGIKNRKTFDRMFPSQDEHKGRGYGNLICLPLQGKFATEEKTVFITNNGLAILDQWQYLRKIQKVTRKEIDQYLEQDIKFTNNPQSNVKIAINTTPMIIDDNEEYELPIITTQNQEVKLILGSNIYIPNIWLPDKIYSYLKKELNFPNPEFYAKERFGYSTWQTARFIKTLEILPDGIVAPLGFLDKLNKFIQREQIKVEIIDQRTSTKRIKFSSKFTLNKEQEQILPKLANYNRVIFEAPSGFGKTMVALAFMKKMGQKTLIIVHTNTLLYQWQKRIADYFSLAKNDLGLIGDNKWEIGEKITIASYMTLFRRGVDEIKNSFGLIIIDECHHVPANTFSSVIKQFTAKHTLGLTATTARKDKLEKLMYLYISDQVITTTNNNQSTTNTELIATIKTELITRKTQFKGNSKLEDFQEVCRLLINDVNRNDQIASNIVAVLATGAKCLVLTERIEHCEKLLELVRQKSKGIHASIATGVMTKKQRKRITKRMEEERFQLLIATGKLIGEGFDWQAVSHLFLTFPFSWKGKLIQYVGRVQRDCDGKTRAVVHDYFDDQVPMLKLMYFKRLRTYRSLGLTKIVNPINKKIINKDQMSLL